MRVEKPRPLLRRADVERAHLSHALESLHDTAHCRRHRALPETPAATVGAAGERMQIRVEPRSALRCEPSRIFVFVADDLGGDIERDVGRTEYGENRCGRLTVSNMPMYQTQLRG